MSSVGESPGRHSATPAVAARGLPGRAERAERAPIASTARVATSAAVSSSASIAMTANSSPP